MGDPKKSKKKYQNPRHPWQKARIEEEMVLVRDYGLKNKREINKHRSQVKRVIDHYKELSYQTTAQAQKEREQLLAKVHALGFLSREKEISAVLDIKLKDALDRRLQTIVFKKNLARSVKQARQFITHRHILVSGKVIDAPGYIVPVDFEHAISFIERSPLFSEMHPERAAPKKKEEAVSIQPQEAPKTEEIVEGVEIAPVEIEVAEEIIEELPLEEVKKAA